MDKTQDLARLRAALKEQFDLLPAPAFAVDSAGRVVYRNRLFRAEFPTLKSRVSAARQLGVSLPLPHESVAVEIAGEDCMLLSEEVSDIGAVRLYYLQRMKDAFSEEYAELFSEYAKELTKQSSHALSRGADDARAREAYLKDVGKRSALLRKSPSLHGALSGVRNLRPDALTPVSAGEMLSFFCSCLAPRLEERGVNLRSECESGIVALLNFYDFTHALTDVLSFYSCFVISREISLSLFSKEGGECVLEVRGGDPYDVLSLYRLFCRGDLSMRRVGRECALFFPLFCAVRRLIRCGHRVRLCHENGELVLSVFVRTTLEFPALVVREDEDKAREAYLDGLMREALIPQGLAVWFFEHLKTLSFTEGSSLHEAKEAKLFD